MEAPCPSARLTVDLDAVAANWRHFARRAPAGAAIKADGYGLGAAAIARRLAAEGCRDFFVATWAEAAALPAGIGVHVLHGVLPHEVAWAAASPHTPVLNSPDQVALWRAAAPGRPCDLMVDTGINRLGLAPADLPRGLSVDILMSHLACADTPQHPMNAVQRDAFAAIDIPARRRSLAASAGALIGPSYGFDLVRPGLALYGGTPIAAGPTFQPVVSIAARVLQIRRVAAGESCGYGATWTASRASSLAIVNLGYADGYLRGFSNRGHAVIGGVRCPAVGRISMDLAAFDITDAAPPGDWLDIGFVLPQAAAASGLSQYELLTTLGHRFDRRYAAVAEARAA